MLLLHVDDLIKRANNFILRAGEVVASFINKIATWATPGIYSSTVCASQPQAQVTIATGGVAYIIAHCKHATQQKTGFLAGIACDDYTWPECCVCNRMEVRLGVLVTES